MGQPDHGRDLERTEWIKKLEFWKQSEIKEVEKKINRFPLGDPHVERAET